MKKLWFMILVSFLYFSFDISASQPKLEPIIIRTDVACDAGKTLDLTLPAGVQNRPNITACDYCGAICFVVILTAPHFVYAYLQNQ